MIDLTDKLADALEECEGMLDRGTYSDAMRLIPIVRRALEAYRAQRDGEREPKICMMCIGSGYMSFHDHKEPCGYCDASGRAPLAKGEG